MERALLILLIAATALAGDRKQYLDDLLKNLPKSSSKITGRVSAVDKNWEDWQKRTGNFLPISTPCPPSRFLPDPLQGVTTREQWAKKRASIRADFEK